MRETTKTITAWMQAVIMLMLVGGLIAWGITEAMKPLSRDELKIEVADVRSYATESLKLAELAAPDKTTRAFFEAHTLHLVDKARETKKSLDDATPESGLEVQHWQARHLAGQVKTELERLSTSFARAQEVSGVENDLNRLYPQLKELEESLQR